MMPALLSTKQTDATLFIMQQILDGDDPWLHLQKSLQEQQVDLDTILQQIVDEITRRLDADRGTLYLLDRARKQLISRIAHLPEIQEIRLAIGEGVAGRVALTGESMCIPQDLHHSPFTPRVDQQTGYQTLSLLAAPVRSDEGRIIGVIQLLNKRDALFDEADRKTLLSMGVRLGGLLQASSLASQLLAPSERPLSFRFNHIVGESPAMRQIYDRTARAARTDATVLIRGESGSGKQLIARAVHFNSERRDAPFVVVDCAALPESLIENELFGHARGAYTGANQARPGKVETANGGTLFIDEVGELPLAVQAKLLRLVQERTFFPVGANAPRQVDVRFVFATHVDLESRVKEGLFRTDLYYRLRVVQIDVPPLRERGSDDLDRLIDHFLFEFQHRHRRPHLRLSDDARAMMHAHHWPGNIRELQHCIESAVVLAPKSTITRDLLSFPVPLHMPPPSPPTQQAPAVATSSELVSLREMERRYILQVLEHVNGNRSAAARILQIGRNTLLRKIQED